MPDRETDIFTAGFRAGLNFAASPVSVEGGQKKPNTDWEVERWTLR